MRVLSTVLDFLQMVNISPVVLMVRNLFLNILSRFTDSSVIIWTLRRRAVEFGSSQTEITWCPYKILKYPKMFTPLLTQNRCHTSDVYDLAWSRDSQYLVSGSIDNSAILWSVERAKKLQILEGHKHFVQGVCLDPKFKYIVTISSDRTARVWKNAKAKKNLTFFQSTVITKFSVDSLEHFDIDVEET